VIFQEAKPQDYKNGVDGLPPQQQES